MQEQFYTDTSTGRKAIKNSALPQLAAGRTIGDQFEQVKSQNMTSGTNLH